MVRLLQRLPLLYLVRLFLGNILRLFRREPGAATTTTCGLFSRRSRRIQRGRECSWCSSYPVDGRSSRVRFTDATVMAVTTIETYSIG